ncbi:hypothetical protein ScPMuIL_006268 [Solemya velum]
MAVQIHVEGHDGYTKAVDENKGKTMFVLFSGSPSQNGESWCPDCVTAKPVVERNLQYVDKDAVFIHCGVGDRAFWKDPKNIFRTDPKLKLKSVPTLLRVGKPQRLEEEKCAKDDLVKMLFSDED